LRNIKVYDNYIWIAISTASASSPNQYNTLRDIESYNNDYNIYMKYAKNNKLSNIETYKSTTQYWVYMESSDYNIITNLNTYSNWRSWLHLVWSANNLFNNIQSYNNSQNGILIINWSLPYSLPANSNVFNNINIYNNSSYWFGTTSTGTVLNNVSIYNNPNGLKSTTDIVLNRVNVYNNTSGLMLYDITFPKKYYGILRTFSNTNVEKTDWLILGTGHSIFSDGVDEISIATTCENKGPQTMTTPVSSYNMWANMPKQTQPVRYNASSVLELYWTDGVDYDTNKFVWIW